MRQEIYNSLIKLSKQIEEGARQREKVVKTVFLPEHLFDKVANIEDDRVFNYNKEIIWIKDPNIVVMKDANMNHNLIRIRYNNGDNEFIKIENNSLSFIAYRIKCILTFFNTIHL